MFIAKREFKRVPVGENVILKITGVEFKPQVNPEVITIKYADNAGATINEQFRTNHDVSMSVFRSRFDAITNNEYADREDFEPKDIINACVGKMVEVKTEDHEYDGKHYTRVKKINKVISGEAPTADVASWGADL